MIKNKGQYITSREAALELGFTTDHVRKLLQTGKIQGEKLGRNWILPISELRKIRRKRFPKEKAP
jgi:excisionase family DNA binding protein